MESLQEAVRSRMTGSMEAAVNQSIQEWLAMHPLIHWLVDHPLGAIALLIALLVLLAGLVGAIARSSEQLWLMLLKAPFQLMAGLFKAGFWAVGKMLPMFLPQSRSSQKQAPPPTQALTLEDQQQAKLQALLEQLEALRQQEDALVAEVRSLLGPVYATVSKKR